MTYQIEDDSADAADGYETIDYDHLIAEANDKAGREFLTTLGFIAIVVVIIVATAIAVYKNTPAFQG